MILIIDDDVAVRTSVSLLLKQAGYMTVSAADPREALQQLQSYEISLIILDMNFSLETTGDEGLELLAEIRRTAPAVPVILITGWATISLAVKGIKAGAFDFINKPWDNQHLLQSVRTALGLSRSLAATGQGPQRHVRREDYDFNGIIGDSPGMMEVLDTVARIAATDASVLIVGESGTGKEMIASAIYRNSLRKTFPFVKVNLGGISSSLFESEMFGHKKGAFTDAKTDRIGRFEMAHNGTIFLDEIGDLEMNSQVKLLRVLQDRTYEVLGSSRTKTVNTRVICATNANLEEKVNDGTFREDLYYRINLITIKLPPLRERASDIPQLVDFYINNLKNVYGRQKLAVDKDALKWLQTQPFPGNIRELKNMVERTVLMSGSDLLTIDDFMLYKQGHVKKAGQQLPPVGAMDLEEMEEAMIKRAMEFHHNNVSRVAETLGLSRGTLYRRLKKYNIPYEDTY
ncbi:DNA-binding transcriptional response regulator, NtrC family, contains REC, AAA-type ATPase, and a Fis-type DNA-binding domains [Chitinophaga rupis]|uniref:DNA-binding transcriptional response regulator, NtrC family, contains REC, AAA-type ATPase, and a Fis-type DNA-binding domains n=1 Tax=Chitinophaga rupis TaxID=573321 RepID=A0A1H8KE96_9BACT|nr:sigma-54 dependent transcriptional regulator [Chitinophaga rupis]SEN91329.1 DNA-binding transcriptional response regulator, NtrC family, contains REC, AAA-type ATPase, and a Fis-type DNA-binding domains [Chitinophaga rupis]